MANNYVMSSFALPASWPEQAKDDFVQIMTALNEWECGESEQPESVVFPEGYEDLTEYLDIDGLCLHGTTWDKGNDPSSRRVGYYDEESFDAVNVEAVVQAIANRYNIPPDQSCYISWAYICDKPKLDEFGGCEVEICCNKEQ